MDRQPCWCSVLGHTVDAARLFIRIFCSSRNQASSDRVVALRATVYTNNQQFKVVLVGHQWLVSVPLAEPLSQHTHLYLYRFSSRYQYFHLNTYIHYTLYNATVSVFGPEVKQRTDQDKTCHNGIVCPPRFLLSFGGIRGHDCRHHV